MKLYHGTNAKFTEFRPDKARIQNDLYGGGLYFSDNLEITKGYAKAMNRKYGGGLYVYEVEYHPKNIFDVNDTFTGKELVKFVDNPEQFARGAGLLKYGADKYTVIAKITDGSYELTGDQIFKAMSNGMNQTAKAREKLIKLGYDGLRYNGGLINQTTGIKHNVYIAYEPEKVKILKTYVIKPKPKMVSEGFLKGPSGEKIISNPSPEQFKTYLMSSENSSGIRMIFDIRKKIWYMFPSDLLHYRFVERVLNLQSSPPRGAPEHEIYAGFRFAFTLEINAKNELDIMMCGSNTNEHEKKEILAALKEPKFKACLKAAKIRTVIIGTNDKIAIQESHSPLNIGRDLLPQIDDPADFLTFMVESGIEFSTETWNICDIKSSQGEFNREKIDGIKRNPDKHPLFFVSNEGYLIDGHHRWIALKELNPNKRVTVIKIPMGLLDIISTLSVDYGLMGSKSVNQ